MKEEKKEYFAITLKPGSLFELEKLTVEKNKIVSSEKHEATYVPIVIGKLMKTLQAMLAGR